MLLSDRNIKELCTLDGSGTFVTLTEKIVHGFHATTSNTHVTAKDGYEVYRFKDKPMIEPFISESVKINEQGIKIPSYGLSSYGYDIRLEPSFKVFNRLTTMGDRKVIDPREPDQSDFFANEYNHDSVILEPGEFLLANTVETFNIPRNVIGMCVGKSTLARCGASVLVTPLEPEWSGQLVVEITNSTTHPMIIRANEGVAQIMFFSVSEACEVSYNDRQGKYQDQTGVTGNKL